MSEARLYIVAYDVSVPKRWRHVVRAIKPVGQRMQLSVFLCRASKPRMAVLETELRQIMDFKEDRLFITDLGLAASAQERIRAENLLGDIMEMKALVV